MSAMKDTAVGTFEYYVGCLRTELDAGAQVRRTADFDRALALANALGAPETTALSWACTLRDPLADAAVTAADLGEEENQALRALADAVLPPRTRPGRRTSIPPG